MHYSMKYLSAVAVISLALASTNASADTLSFGPATIPTATPFTTYTQDGFTITQGVGQFVENIFQGNPPEAITGGDVVSNSFATNSVIVTDGGGAFIFTGLDLNDYSNAASYTITGSYLGSTVFTKTGTDSAVSGWTTIDFSGISSADVDTLTISLTDNSVRTDYALDNIVVTSVPEPGTLALLGTGLLGFGAAVRRRLSI